MRLSALILAIALSAAGCFDSHSLGDAPVDLGLICLGGTCDAGVASDVGVPPGGELCGDALCPAGAHCCPLCPGEDPLCLPAEVACPFLLESDCQRVNCVEGQDVRAVGDCDAIIGVAWTGQTCRTLSGCSCAGTDCARLYRSLRECDDANEGCHICGTVAGLGCPTGEFCATGAIVGGECAPFPDESGVCLDLPTTCSGTLDPVCGCDGTTYENGCFARLEGQWPVLAGPCGRR